MGYQYQLLQVGSLPLQPDGERDYSHEHRCTSALIWPEAQLPTPENAILTDPCFTRKGFERGEEFLKRLKVTIEELSYIFVTHRHGDHMPNFLYKKKPLEFQKQKEHVLGGVSFVSCPGHALDLRSLSFPDSSGQRVLVVGDAILNERWLKAWGYYWPNFYTQAEVIQTWQSVARILKQADIIIPGHGGQIIISPTLLQTVLENFPAAEYADECPEVKTILTRRLKELETRDSRNT